MTLLQKPTFWYFGVFVWFAVLWIASSQSSVMPPTLFSFQDKVEHACYFAAGSFCFLMARKLSGARSLFLPALLFAMIMGVVDEFHQSFTPGRSGNDWGDWLADSVGGVLAYAVSRIKRA